MKTRILIYILSVAASAAQVPSLINYQGRLVSGTNLVNGNVSLSLRLYNAPAGGTLLYEDSNSVTVADGLYTTFLGDNTVSGSLSNALLGLPLYLEVSVDGTPLLPREQVASVAYALRAGGVGTGAVTADMLQKKYQSGTVQFELPYTNIFAGGTPAVTSSTTVAFNPVFNVAPIVTLGVETPSASDAGAANPFVTSRFSNEFTMSFIVPTGTGTVSQIDPNAGNPPTSLEIVNGNPAISFRDVGGGDEDVAYARALNADGTAWGTRVIVDSNGFAGIYNSLAVVNGNPAIAYQEQLTDVLWYARSSDTTGSAWPTRIAVDTNGTLGEYCTLKVVAGNPAIGYLNSSLFNPMYVRALDANGATWGAPVRVDTNTPACPGNYASLEVINGNPAISYTRVCAGFSLYYVRANDPTGGTWGVPVPVFTNGNVRDTDLEMINGRPAIAFRMGLTTGDLFYVRANDINGSSWGTAISVDNATNDVGASPSMKTIRGKPAISYYEGFPQANLKYVSAVDADGAVWNQPLHANTGGDTGQGSSMEEMNGRPAISFAVGGGSNDLYFIRGAGSPTNFLIHWIAVEP